MSKIKIMSDALASQVAAGEVVERPAAVLRELLDNSLDAGASEIAVHVQHGGTALIRVIDNGSGMDREDALLCLERHATSKIKTKEDLSAIYTYGFRGEAIPSIASVSRFKLSTRLAHQEVGTEIEVHGGKLMEVRDFGGAGGTTVEARSLFYNVPARRKFLRAENTEYSHVEQMFRQHAIAHPQVTFTLVKDGNVAYHLPGTEGRFERIQGLVGKEVAEQLLEVKLYQHFGIKISGFISGPGLSRANKQLQITYLNGRVVEGNTLFYGIRDGYETALMKGQYPLTFLMIEMEPDLFDINVHPAKKEVRFVEAGAVRMAIAKAIQVTLGQMTQFPQGFQKVKREISATVTMANSILDIVEPISQTMPHLIPLPKPIINREFNQVNSREALSFIPELKKIENEDIKNSDIQVTEVNHDNKLEQTNQELQTTLVTEQELRLIGVLNHLYIILENKEGLVLMDQHAAHERINFEKMMRMIRHEKTLGQRLLIPLTVQLTPKDADFVMRHLGVLAKTGIEMEPFGLHTFKIETLPFFIKQENPLYWINELIEELAILSTKNNLLRMSEDLVATTVCRKSIKANDRLSVPEIHALIKDLMACEMPYCCPHGRPTLIQMTMLEIEKKFGRKV